MKKDLGVRPYVFPMPVLMIATYDEQEKVDVMNMAWGGVCDDNMVALNISEEHQTTDNIKKRMALTFDTFLNVKSSNPFISGHFGAFKMFKIVRTF